MSELAIAKLVGQLFSANARLADDVARMDELLSDLLAVVSGKDQPWAFPIGSERFPVPNWYCAQYHTYDHDTNPWGHTGLDLNADLPPWGDVDRDEPVFAVAAGTVHDAGSSAGWLGVVVVRHEHDDKQVWIRYAHLDPPSITARPGDPVQAGRELGRIGNYTQGRGGDHLHFDAAWDPFGWAYYRTRWIRWTDPLPILKAHLDPQLVSEMLKKSG